MDAPPPARLPFLRIAALLLVCIGCFAAPAAAQADDLIQLSGDPAVTLAGNRSFGLLYLDGVVRLGGDTAITANDIFIGPDAQVQTCYDIATDGANNCVNGRSLYITASGGVAISTPLDLRGGTGANRIGGSLVIKAARVSLGGNVDTTGIAAPSGSITIDSPGLVVTQTLRAPGAGIFAHGGTGILVGGDVWTAGSDTATGSDPGRQTSGGAIDVASSGGDVTVLGQVASWGRDVAGAGGLQGGHGGPVALSGGDVRVSVGIDAHAGRGVDTTAGQAGPITAGARGPLAISGPVSAAGGASTSGYGTDGGAIVLSAAATLTAGSISSAGGASTNAGAGGGGNVTLTAGGALSAGAINAAGAGSALNGRHGGAVSVTGASVGVGAITTDAGDATSDPQNGTAEAGGPVTVKATTSAGVGSVSSRGGSGRALGGGGPGGTISISGDKVTTGAITALGENLSGPGGNVTIASQTALLVGGAIDTSGAAGGNGSPGGAGGPITLTALHGALTLGGRLRAEGGTGATAAPGGRGGAIELVVQSLAASAGVLSGGGNGGNPAAQNGPRGPGGAGGRVRIWAQVSSMILLQFVDSSGGAGDPNGADGAQQDEFAPTGFSVSKTGMVAFTPHAPEAEGYRLFASLAGTPAKLVMTTKTSGIAVPKVAPCVKADYTLAGFHSGVGWQSDPVGPVSLMLPPSATQECTDAAQVTFGVQKLKKKVKALKKKKWRFHVTFLADGMGTAHVVLSRKSKKLATADKPLLPVRRNVSVTLTIPKKLRKAGKFTVTVTGSAPIGKARSKSTLTLEVKK